jgi:UDP-glucose 4-epimerase
MKCLVLGGLGFIGKHVCHRLVAGGYAVRIFDRAPSDLAAIPAGCDFFAGDFNNPDDILNAIVGCDYIFHLISTTQPKSSNVNMVFDVESNVISTLRLLNIAVDSNIKKIVFASSGGTVYGIPKSIPISETHELNPISSYGICKIAIEKYLYLFSELSGLDFCVLRLSNPYGEFQSPLGSQGALTVFAFNAIHDREISIWGDGSVVRDYIYVEDVAEAFFSALDYQGRSRVFNIGSGIGHSLNDLIYSIEAELGRSVKRRFYPARDFDVPSNVLDVSDSLNNLNWKPNTDLRTGLAKTINWLRLL